LIRHKLTSIPNLLDITNQAKPHLNSFPPTRSAKIISNYKECLQLLCVVDELSVPAFVGPDEMGDLVDDMETMFCGYQSARLVGLVFRFYLPALFNHLRFSLVLPSR
jgi:hypothetical protein